MESPNWNINMRKVATKGKDDYTCLSVAYQSYLQNLNFWPQPSPEKEHTYSNTIAQDQLVHTLQPTQLPQHNFASWPEMEIICALVGSG